MISSRQLGQGCQQSECFLRCFYPARFEPVPVFPIACSSFLLFQAGQGFQQSLHILYVCVSFGLVMVQSEPAPVFRVACSSFLLFQLCQGCYITVCVFLLRFCPSSV